MSKQVRECMALRKPAAVNGEKQTGSVALAHALRALVLAALPFCASVPRRRDRAKHRSDPLALNACEPQLRSLPVVQSAQGGPEQSDVIGLSVRNRVCPGEAGERGWGSKGSEELCGNR